MVSSVQNQPKISFWSQAKASARGHSFSPRSPLFSRFSLLSDRSHFLTSANSCNMPIGEKNKLRAFEETMKYALGMKSELNFLEVKSFLSGIYTREKISFLQTISTIDTDFSMVLRKLFVDSQDSDVDVKRAVVALSLCGHANHEPRMNLLSRLGCDSSLYVRRAVCAALEGNYSKESIEILSFIATKDIDFSVRKRALQSLVKNCENNLAQKTVEKIVKDRVLPYVEEDRRVIAEEIAPKKHLTAFDFKIIREYVLMGEMSERLLAIDMLQNAPSAKETIDMVDEMTRNCNGDVYREALKLLVRSSNPQALSLFERIEKDIDAGFPAYCTVFADVVEFLVNVKGGHGPIALKIIERQLKEPAMFLKNQALKALENIRSKEASRVIENEGQQMLEIIQNDLQVGALSLTNIHYFRNILGVFENNAPIEFFEKVWNLIGKLENLSLLDLATLCDLKIAASNLLENNQEIRIWDFLKGEASNLLTRQGMWAQIDPTVGGHRIKVLAKFLENETFSESAWKIIFDAAKNETLQIRYFAAETLRGIKDSRAYDILESLAHDPEEGVKIAVASSLINDKSERALDILNQLSKCNSSNVRRKICKALEGVNSEKALDILEYLLQVEKTSSVPFVLKEAALVLMTIKKPRAKEMLAKLLCKPNDLMGHAAYVFANIVDKPFFDLFLQASRTLSSQYLDGTLAFMQRELIKERRSQAIKDVLSLRSQIEKKAKRFKVKKGGNGKGERLEDGTVYLKESDTPSSRTRRALSSPKGDSYMNAEHAHESITRGVLVIDPQAVNGIPMQNLMQVLGASAAALSKRYGRVMIVLGDRKLEINGNLDNQELGKIFVFLEKKKKNLTLEPEAFVRVFSEAETKEVVFLGDIENYDSLGILEHLISAAKGKLKTIKFGSRFKLGQIVQNLAQLDLSGKNITHSHENRVFNRAKTILVDKESADLQKLIDALFKPKVESVVEAAKRLPLPALVSEEETTWFPKIMGRVLDWVGREPLTDLDNTSRAFGLAMLGPAATGAKEKLSSFLSGFLANLLGSNYSLRFENKLNGQQRYLWQRIGLVANRSTLVWNEAVPELMLSHDNFGLRKGSLNTAEVSPGIIAVPVPTGASLESFHDGKATFRMGLGLDPRATKIGKMKVSQLPEVYGEEYPYLTAVSRDSNRLYFGNDLMPELPWLAQKEWGALIWLGRKLSVKWAKRLITFYASFRYSYKLFSKKERAQFEDLNRRWEDGQAIGTHEKLAFALRVGGGACAEKAEIAAVLARMMGIPTVYVGGYVGDKYGLREGSEGHAWSAIAYPSTMGEKKYNMDIMETSSGRVSLLLLAGAFLMGIISVPMFIWRYITSSTKRRIKKQISRLGSTKEKALPPSENTNDKNKEKIADNNTAMSPCETLSSAADEIGNPSQEPAPVSTVKVKISEGESYKPEKATPYRRDILANKQRELEAWRNMNTEEQIEALKFIVSENFYIDLENLEENISLKDRLQYLRLEVIKQIVNKGSQGEIYNGVVCKVQDLPEGRIKDYLHILFYTH